MKENLLMKNFNSEIAIGLNTFIRDENLKRFVASCQTFYPELKIYIIEQGRIEEPKKKFYEYLQDEGHIIHQIPFDSGISYAREELRKIVKEPYLMYMQDDFIVTNDTKIYKMLHILKSDPKVGVVCGALISCRKEITPVPIDPIIHGHYLNKCDTMLSYIPINYLFKLNLLDWKKTKSKGLKYTYCDMSWDFSLWDLKAQENLFDSNVHVIEHSHVYLNLKKYNKYKVAYTPESVIIHTHDRSNKEYDNFRKRKSDIDYLLDYWNITSMTNLETERILPPLHKLIAPIEEKKVEEEIITPIIATPDSFNNLNINANGILQEFVMCFRIFNKKIFLSEDTCLQGVLKHTIKGNNLYFSTYKLTNNEKDILAEKGFFYSEKDNAYIKNEYKIILNYKIPRDEKNITINGQAYAVPFPVHGYLKNLYGREWQELGKKYE